MSEKVLLTNQVFGVSNEAIETYIEREEVDNLFLEAISTNKHIVIYGASKQGKTALTNKHLYTFNYIRVNCSHNTMPVDIYKSIIRQLNIEFEESKNITNTFGGEPKAGIKANVKIPFLGSIEATGELDGKLEREISKGYKTVEYNLELAQDISEILNENRFNKRIILENFHYLSQEAQQQLSYDLRIFEDYNILFIILGIWREKNRLGQFNGDLLDRLIEIPVEPWHRNDLKKIIKEGEPLLSVDFSNITDALIDRCFDSVGVFQELCKESCYAAGINKTGDNVVVLTKENLETAIGKKLQAYSSRHIKCLESFVEQKVKSSEDVPLYIAYYFVKILFDCKFEEAIEGFRNKVLLEKIKAIHHRPENVRPSDIGYFLQNLASSQTKKGISPPIFDFDQSTSSLKIIDSTFYFFLRNCNKEEVLEFIPTPVGL
jgi:Cdc6-like AAA superfamily ATPase